MNKLNPIAEIEIRTTHPYGYKSGEWGLIRGVVWDRTMNRPGYWVEFEDGTFDYWVVYGGSEASYEFRERE